MLPASLTQQGQDEKKKTEGEGEGGRGRGKGKGKGKGKRKRQRQRPGPLPLASSSSFPFKDQESWNHGMGFLERSVSKLPSVWFLALLLLAAIPCRMHRISSDLRS